MADPAGLTPAQRRALSRARSEGRLYSGDGVSASTVQCLEREGLVRITWTRRNVTAWHDEIGWATRVESTWTAEPVIDDYQVFLRSDAGEFKVTVYAAVSLDDAVAQAKARFWARYCDGIEVYVTAVKTESLSIPLWFFA